MVTILSHRYQNHLRTERAIKDEQGNQGPWVVPNLDVLSHPHYTTDLPPGQNNRGQDTIHRWPSQILPRDHSGVC